MKTFLIFLTSVYLLFTSQLKSVVQNPKNSNPTPTNTTYNTLTPKDTSIPEESFLKPSKPPVSTTVPIITQTQVKTPTNTLATDGTYDYVITIRPGESILLTTIRPMKGSSTISVELPQSGAPAGVYFTQDQANDRNIFLHVNSSATQGKYTWRQSFKSTHSTGVGAGNLSMGIQLTILPAL